MRSTWKVSSWSGCNPMPNDLSLLLKLHQALADREWSSVSDIGRTWFNSTRSASLSAFLMLSYFIHAVSVPYAGDAKAMLSADATFGHKVNWPSTLINQRALLNSLANTPKP